MRHLPVLQPHQAQTGHFDLDALEVETPCEVPWDSMRGDNRVRYCGHCRQNVYNIEALPRAEAVRLVSVREGRPCIRFYRRRDGTVVTADCWARLRAARRKGLLAFAAMLVLVGVTELFAMAVGLTHLKRITGQAEAIPVHEIRPVPPETRRMGYLAPRREYLETMGRKSPSRSSSLQPPPKPVLTPPFILNRIKEK